MCWVNKIDDAIMVTAGEDKNIHILSLANCKEIAVLSGHGGKYNDKELKLYLLILVRKSN